MQQNGTIIYEDFRIEYICRNWIIKVLNGSFFRVLAARFPKATDIAVVDVSG